MNPRLSLRQLAKFLSLSIAAYKHTFTYLFPMVLLVFLIGCSRSGLYSVIVTNPGVQHERNDLMDLPEPYHRKEVIFPSSVVRMSDANKRKWNDTLKHLTVHKIDTSFRIDVLSLPASAKVRASQCGNNGIAIVLHDASQVRRRGKLIDVALRYVCIEDSPDMVWAATEFYKIEGMNECPDGFHTIEFQFVMPRVLKDRKEANLTRVIAVCADP